MARPEQQVVPGDVKKTGLRSNPVWFIGPCSAWLQSSCSWFWGTGARSHWFNAPVHYVTEFGEGRGMTLSDGSRVLLDSLSEITVNCSRTAREPCLWRGLARFDVAHDVERPFSVIAGDRKVVAAGTAFNTDLTGGRVVVTLIHGHVAVHCR